MSLKDGYPKEYEELLGTDYDHVIAKRLGITKLAANRARFVLGIPRYSKKNHKSHVDFTPEMVHDLDKMTIKAFSAKWNVSTQTVLLNRHKRGMKGHVANNPHVPKELEQKILRFAGRFLDSHIADYAGCSREYVRLIRERHGIATPDKTKLLLGFFKAEIERLEAEVGQ
jgi:hypothetical protein